MELRVLTYFVATAQELNMTKAAQKLLVSQPALSRQIADLKDELGGQVIQPPTTPFNSDTFGTIFIRASKRNFSFNCQN